MLSQSKQNKVGSALRATVCPLWPVQIKAKADLKKKKKKHLEVQNLDPNNMLYLFASV